MQCRDGLLSDNDDDDDDGDCSQDWRFCSQRQSSYITSSATSQSSSHYGDLTVVGTCSIKSTTMLIG